MTFLLTELSENCFKVLKNELIYTKFFLENNDWFYYIFKYKISIFSKTITLKQRQLCF